MKPANILIGEDGYLHLTDFGVSKRFQDNELCIKNVGSPEYKAPEIVGGKGHDMSCDWWSLGIFIHDMVFGFPPYYSTDLADLNNQILTEAFDMPDPEDVGLEFSPELSDLLRRLLVKDPRHRLGSKHGMLELSSHPWFKDVDFAKVYKKEIVPAYKPQLSQNMNDLSCFDSEFTSCDLMDSELYDVELIQQNQHLFDNFIPKG